MKCLCWRNPFCLDRWNLNRGLVASLTGGGVYIKYQMSLIYHIESLILKIEVPFL